MIFDLPPEPPKIWLPSKPAIIRAAPPVFRVCIGEQYGTDAVEYHEWAFPRDIRDASFKEALAYIPKHLRETFPEWSLERLLPTLGIFGPPPFWNASSGPVKTIVFLTTTDAGNQTWTVLGDWESTDNLVEVIGSGGSGGVRRGNNSNSTNAHASGGAGAGYSGQSNISLTPSGSATYRLPAGGAGVTASSANTTLSGNAGQDAWFNGASLGASSVGAKGGANGTGGTGAQDGGAGGAAGSGVGTTRTSGGNGGNANSTVAAGGGGGAGGPSSNGTAGSTGVNSAADGGAGGSPSGGSGSSGSSSGDSGAGNDGTGFQASPARGSGGGSGGARGAQTTDSRASGAGGNFGAGSGGCVTRNTGGNTGVAASGNGAPALIVITNNASL